MFKHSLMCAIAFLCSVEFSMANMPTPYISENEGPLLSWYHENITNPKQGYEYFAPKSVDEVSTLHNICGSEADEMLFIHVWCAVVTNVRGEFSYRCLDGIKPLIAEYIKNAFTPFIKATDEFYTSSKPPYAGILAEDLYCFAGELEGIYKEPNTEFEGATRESTHLHYAICEIDKIFNASVHFKDVKLLEYYEEHYLGISHRSEAERQEDEKLEAAMLQAITCTLADGFSPKDYTD